MIQSLRYIVLALVLVACGDGRLSPQGGTITSVGAGSGATGGGTAGAVTINVVPATGGGLVATADAIGLSTACGASEVLAWDGDSWECGSAGGTVEEVNTSITGADFTLGSTTTVLRLNPSASFTMSGMTGGAAGRRVTIVNPTGWTVQITNEDNASTAANRFLTLASQGWYLESGRAIEFYYDVAVSRWRMVGLSTNFYSTLTVNSTLVVGSTASIGGALTVTDLRGTKISTVSLSGTVNDLAPTGLATATIISIAASGAVDLTGLTGGAANRRIILYNDSSYTVIIYNENALSTDVNRFLTTGGYNTPMVSKSFAEIWYDGTVSRWRLGSVSGGFFPLVYSTGPIEAAGLVTVGTTLGVASLSTLTGGATLGAETIVSGGSIGDRSTNGVHFGFASNAGTISSTQPGTANRSLTIQGSPLILQGDGTTALTITGNDAAFVDAVDVAGTLTVDGTFRVGPFTPVGVTPYSYINGLRISGGDEPNTIYQTTADTSLNITINSSLSTEYVGIGQVSSPGLVVTGADTVGIGDATPDYLLDVAGTLGVDGNSTLGDSAADNTTVWGDLNIAEASSIGRVRIAGGTDEILQLGGIAGITRVDLTTDMGGTSQVIVQNTGVTIEDGLTVGDDSTDVLDVNGDLSKFGTSAGDGSAYFVSNVLGFKYDTNATTTGYINYYGYNGGHTQFRDLDLSDGKGATACYLTGSTKTLNCIGGLQVNGVNVGVSTSVSGTATYIPKFTSSSAIGNSNITDSGSLISINSSAQLASTANAMGLYAYNAQTGQTSTDMHTILAYNYGSFNTTGGAASNKGVTGLAHATRSAGSNALTNYGVYGAASGGQTNYAGYFGDGLMHITNATTITSTLTTNNTIEVAGGPTYQFMTSGDTTATFNVWDAASDTELHFTNSGPGKLSTVFGGSSDATYFMLGANENVHIRGGVAASQVELGGGGVNTGGIYIGWSGNPTIIGSNTTSVAGTLEVDGAARLDSTLAVGGSGTALLNTTTNFAKVAVDIDFNSRITLGAEGSAQNGDPAITMYRTSAGLSTGTAARFLMNNSVFDLRIQQGTNDTAYGAETYSDLMTFAASGLVTVPGALTVDGNATLGDADADVLDVNGELTKFGGSTNQDGAVYISTGSSNSRSINAGYANDTDGTGLVFNWTGYNNGQTRYRNIAVYDGKGGLVATLAGIDKEAVFYGNLTAAKVTSETVRNDRTRGFEFFEEFLSVPATGGNWQLSNALAVTAEYAYANNRPGVIVLVTQANGVGAGLSTAAVYQGSLGEGASWFAGGGATQIETAGMFTVVPTASPSFTVAMGLMSTLVADDSNEGVYCKATNDSANWQACTAENGSATCADTSPVVPKAANSWVRCGAVVNAAGTSVTFTITDVTLAVTGTRTETATIPNEVAYQAGLEFVNSRVGTTGGGDFYVDYAWFKQTFTTAR